MNAATNSNVATGYHYLAVANVTTSSWNNSSADGVITAPSPDEGAAAAEAAAAFFDHYRKTSRFTLETCFAIVTLVVNVTALIVAKHKQHQHYAYYALFRNLAFVNTLQCLCIWFSNNFMYFGLGSASFSLNIAVMSVVEMMSTSLGLVSSSTLFGFSVVHYIAVCYPLMFPSRLSVRNTRVSLASIWLFFVAIGLTEVGVIVLMYATDRVAKLHQIALVTAVASIVVLQCIVIVTYLVCLRIYIKIRSLQRRLERFNRTFSPDMKVEKRTLLAIVLLVTNLTVLYLPFNILYLVSMLNFELANRQALILFMTLMPYVKLACDPILYKITYSDVMVLLGRLYVWLSSLFVCHRRKERLNSISTRVTRVSCNVKREHGKDVYVFVHRNMR